MADARSADGRGRIVVRVSPDGQVSAETRAIKGPACLDYIAVLESLLHATAAASSFTEEYRQTTTTAATENQHGVQQS